jgi:hypothetical protein
MHIFVANVPKTYLSNDYFSIPAYLRIRDGQSYRTERRGGGVVSIPASYSGGLGLKSRPGHQIS